MLMARMESDTLERTIGFMRADIQRMVGAGFDPPEDIPGIALVLIDSQVREVLRPVAEQLTREAIDAHLAAQEHWPAVTDCDRLDRAFEELGRAGIVSRHHVACDGPSEHAEIRDEIAAAREGGLEVRGYTVYDFLDAEFATEGWPLYLYYGAVEEGEEPALRVAHEVVDALQRQGLHPEWDGTLSKAIKLEVDWKRRRPGGGGSQGAAADRPRD
jgi:hypothetical protein